MPRQMPTTLRPRIALKPAEDASSSRSKSAAVVSDVNTPSRTVRPPFRLFDPFSAGLDQFQPTAFKTPVHTSVATEFNSRERIYCTIFPPACAHEVRVRHICDANRIINATRQGVYPPSRTVQNPSPFGCVTRTATPRYRRLLRLSSCFSFLFLTRTSRRNLTRLFTIPNTAAWPPAAVSASSHPAKTNSYISPNCTPQFGRLFGKRN